MIMILIWNIIGVTEGNGKCFDKNGDLISNEEVNLLYWQKYDRRQAKY